ncbi:unnamed protein product, partial [Rotaria magnacalcarata]
GVTAIDGQDASSMKHEDAENLLRNALQIQLAVRRGQFAAVRPSRPPVKFGASSQPHV